ncbi:MAG TPA: hypothetical protein VK844_09300 [Hyphomicrobiales bacterium]|nr:hypothetical protein [Hyphomicrobiales bacterium]
MSSLSKTLFIGACLAVAAFQVARAADMPPIVEVDYGPPPAEGGWYLRGDIGYVIPEDPVVTYADGAVSFINEDLGTT